MKIPAAYSNAGGTRVSAGAAPTKVTARIDMSAEVAGQGLCPDCHKPMVEMVAGAVDTLTCMPCRISLPTADPVEVVEDDAKQVDLASAGPNTYQDQ